LIEKLNKINVFLNHNPVKSHFNIRELLNETIIDLQKDFQVEVEFLLHKEEICTDRVLFHSIVKSLIENAFTYKRLDEAHKVVISFSTGTDNVLTIWDNGMGISEEIQPNVYNMFFRGTEKSKGHGLGLYLTKKALDKLNGKINLNSKFGEFTEVTIVF
jgi:signal transduction histidine kinase